MRPVEWRQCNAESPAAKRAECLSNRDNARDTGQRGRSESQCCECVRNNASIDDRRVGATSTCGRHNGSPLRPLILARWMRDGPAERKSQIAHIWTRTFVLFCATMRLWASVRTDYRKGKHMRRKDQRSKRVFDFICRYINEQGFPPTLCEMAADQGFKSISGVVRHLDKLEKWGWIERYHGHARSIRILRKPRPAPVNANGGSPFRQLVPRR